jgi:Tol biopolymer transport system component
LEAKVDALRRSTLVTVVGFSVVALVSTLVVRAQPGFSDWSAPINLGSVVNSAFNDSGPTLSKSDLTLYFASDRTGTLGANDIWVSQRNSIAEPWGPPMNLGAAVNSPGDDNSPNLSRDGHWLFFMSRRPGSQLTAAGVVGFDIWASYRDHVHDDFDWQPPVNVAAVNSPSFDQSPFFFDNEDAGVPQLFFTRTTPTGNRIFVSDLLDGTFSAPGLVAELNSTANDRGVSVRFDGREVFLMSTRPGGEGAQDLWTATRDTVFDPWSTPTNLGAVVNSVGGDFDPYLSSDRQTLYFMSNRTGGLGGQDLYVTTRVRHNR